MKIFFQAEAGILSAFLCYMRKASTALFFGFQTFLIFLLLYLQQDVQRYKLGNPRTFHYLNQTNCFELDGVDDSKEYIATRRAMEVVGISTDEQVFHRELVQVEDRILQV